MAETKKETPQAGVATTPQPSAQPARPNRDAYAAMWKEDNPDIDFEDKEARYGRMAEERSAYRGLRSSGKKLSESLNKHPWVAAMIQDVFNDERGELDPITWLYRNGIDVQKAMEDEAYRKGAVEGLKAWIAKQEAGKANDEQMDENAYQSQQNLSDLAEELNLSNDQCNKMWNHLFNDVIAPGMNFEVSKDTWKMVLHAMNYDADIENARNEAAIQARNEKFSSKVKNFNDQQIPPSFSQGRSQKATPSRKKEGFFDDLANYH